mmetsp:Transcript_28930/g.35160  ORF Transcript_28930/g.35160 Transcript_28930/m.35160 type:complete len:401 (-) Transcript_28930:544-1746(-)|eukprot:CAMPEP_0197846150 /NCGR_PEP_ID=MMETSP1438-20131217/2948_1 /TAXON_ID=1461541 /ORGANISM="Pterosperma sp., Strain CCMP1384" /LENGTH=400 /DNA_ID=CAMNT_0043457697 /DNA_START=123 /DNA_END=1325 /DNA_ORIENTATION=-
MKTYNVLVVGATLLVALPMGALGLVCDGMAEASCSDCTSSGRCTWNTRTSACEAMPDDSCTGGDMVSITTIITEEPAGGTCGEWDCTSALQDPSICNVDSPAVSDDLPGHENFLCSHACQDAMHGPCCSEFLAWDVHKVFDYMVEDMIEMVDALRGYTCSSVHEGHGDHEGHDDHHEDHHDDHHDDEHDSDDEPQYPACTEACTDMPTSCKESIEMLTTGCAKSCSKVEAVMAQILNIGNEVVPVSCMAETSAELKMDWATMGALEYAIQYGDNFPAGSCAGTCTAAPTSCDELISFFDSGCAKSCSGDSKAGVTLLLVAEGSSFINDECVAKVFPAPAAPTEAPAAPTEAPATESPSPDSSSPATAPTSAAASPDASGAASITNTAALFIAAALAMCSA